MCFNDDFDFDGYDGPDDDFSEDVFEDEFESEMQEDNDEPFAPESEDSESAFGFREVFILGGIFGQAYEEWLDEKEQQNKKDNDDDGEDLL